MTGSPWSHHARQWGSVGPPLRPSAEDLAIAAAAIANWAEDTGRQAAGVAVLGVTPELCALPGAGSRVLALDHSLDMIDAVWPGRLRPGDRAVCADWRRLPLRRGSVDMVLCDGCLSILPYPAGYARVAEELLQVLSDGGRCVARCFVQLENPESVADVLADLGAGRVAGFHAFKWRLVMALQRDPEEGVALGEVWEAFHASEPDLAALCRRCDWTLAEVRTIDAYRDVDARYSFPTAAMLRDLFSDAGFHVLRVVQPAYELGERCPSFVLRPGA